MKKWSLYLLFHAPSNRTYLGITTDIVRRVRQHNQEISGGARFTTRILNQYPKTSWMLIATLASFETQSEVTRWERLLKLKTRGIKPRLAAFKALAISEYPKEFTPKMRASYVIPEGLTILYHDILQEYVA